MSYVQMMKDILHFSDEEIKKSIEDQLIEKKLVWRLNKLTEDGMYEEPDPKSSKLLGLEKDNNIFNNLIFENVNKNIIRELINEKLDKEINALIYRKPVGPDPKMIDTIINKNYSFENRFNSKIINNLIKTERDILI